LNQHGNVPMETACRNRADRMKIWIVTPGSGPRKINVITGKEYVPEPANRSGRKPSSNPDLTSTWSAIRSRAEHVV
jgi:hypothetical protein